MGNKNDFIFIAEAAALGGHVHILEWIKQQDCVWKSEEVCSNAALNGHTDVLKWLKENECHWDVSICSNSAKGGHLNTLEWLMYELFEFTFTKFLM